MKKLVIGVAVYFAAIVFTLCSVCIRQKDSDSKSQTNEVGVQSSEILEILASIDEVVEWVHSSSGDAVPSGVSDNSAHVVYDSAAVVWNTMKEYLVNNRFKDAYDLYKNNRGNIIVHLAHSSARFPFLSEIVWPLLSEFEDIDSAMVSYRDDLAFEYWMQVASIQFSTEGNSYMPEVHPETIKEYGCLLSKTGREAEALTMADELLESLIALGSDEMHANTERALYGAVVMYNAGYLNEAIGILEDFKALAEKWCAEDIVADPDCKDYYEYYIGEVNKEIAEYMKEADYVSVFRN